MGRTRLLRLKAPTVPDRAPRVLGADEFAFRKGCTYGTVLVDVEAGRVVGVLPDRTSKTFAAWPAEHPGAEIICRDRATAHTKAAREAAPHPLEVADRWHRAAARSSANTSPPSAQAPPNRSGPTSRAPVRSPPGS